MNVSTNISHYETGNDMSRYHQQKKCKNVNTICPYKDVKKT